MTIPVAATGARKNALAGLGAFGLTTADSADGYTASDFLKDITRGGLDIAKTVLTPPTYESGPGGTIIRTPAPVSSQPSGSVPTQGYATQQSSTGLYVALGVAAITVVMVMSNRR